MANNKSFQLEMLRNMAASKTLLSARKAVPEEPGWQISEDLVKARAEAAVGGVFLWASLLPGLV